MEMRIRWQGNAATRAAMDAMRKAAHEGMEAVLTETIPVTPKDEGNLRNSGHVTPASAAQVQDEVAVVFDTPYAVRVHEGVGMRFQEPGTKAKFLEDTFNQKKQDILRHIGNAVERALR